MSRTVSYDPEGVCDICGSKGAHDFMGDLYCNKCFNSEQDVYTEDGKEPEFVTPEYYFSDDGLKDLQETMCDGLNRTNSDIGCSGVCAECVLFELNFYEFKTWLIKQTGNNL